MAVNQACEAGGNLQMTLIGRFCKFQKNKTVNYHLQVCEGASRSCQDKTGRWVSPDKWTKY